MKKIISFFIVTTILAFSQQEKVKIGDIVNVRWKMKRYITDGINLPVERSRRKDYQIFKPNNKREETLFGKKYENLKKGLPIILLFTHSAIPRDKSIEEGITPNAYIILFENTFQNVASSHRVS